MLRIIYVELGAEEKKFIFSSLSYDIFFFQDIKPSFFTKNIVPNDHDKIIMVYSVSAK